MTTLNEALITDMGILSNQVYDDINEYFVFENGERKRSTITTTNGTYTIIDSTDIPVEIDSNSMHSLTSMNALLLKAPDGKFVIAFRGTQETGDDLLYGGDGDAILLGSEGSDYLNGGADFDTYISGNNDVIYDSDGSGIIVFEGCKKRRHPTTHDVLIRPAKTVASDR